MRYNGKDPRMLHRGISVNKEYPLPGPLSDIHTISGASGEVPAGRSIMQGEYRVTLNIAGKTRAEAWEMRKLIAAWACAADTVTHELIPTHWPTVAYDAMLKELGEPDLTLGYGTVDVTFAVPHPFAHDLQWSVATGSAVVDLQIGGTHNTRPVIEIIAAGSNGLSVAIDGETQIKLSGTFSVGQVIHIDTAKRSVIVDNDHAERRIVYTETRFANMVEACKPGRHTLSCPEAVSMIVRWRNEWM